MQYLDDSPQIYIETDDLVEESIDLDGFKSNWREIANYLKDANLYEDYFKSKIFSEDMSDMWRFFNQCIDLSGYQFKRRVRYFRIKRGLPTNGVASFAVKLGQRVKE